MAHSESAKAEKAAIAAAAPIDGEGVIDGIDRRKTEEFRAAARARAQRQWTPEARAKARAKSSAQWTPEARARHSDLTKAKMATPEFQGRRAEQIRTAWTPERRMAQSQLMKAKLASTALRQKISEATRRGMAAADVRERALEARARKRAAMIEALLALWAVTDEATRQQFLSEVSLLFSPASAFLSSPGAGASEC